MKTIAACAGWACAEGQKHPESASGQGSDVPVAPQLRRRQINAALAVSGVATLASSAPAWAQRAGEAKGAVAVKPAPVSPTKPAAPNPTPLSWPVADPVLAARHQRAFAGMAAQIDAKLNDVQSVVVLHQGHLALEYYRHRLNADSLQDTQSVTKSVLALLFGCAQADGLVRGTNELVGPRLPEMLRLATDARVRDLRFEHLLTMTAGWPGEETARRDRDDDLRQLVQRPFVAAPGTRFAYDNGAANLLALALANIVGKPLSAYASERLLAPLGIGSFNWRQGAKGHDLGALGLSLTARAMARVGELVLAEGRWAGRALVPADFVQRATERRNAGGAPLYTAYGYLWWVASTAAPRGATARTAMANGYGGQWIYVYPPLQLVVAVTSRRTPESMARGQAATLIRKDILTAVRKSGA